MSRFQSGERSWTSSGSTIARSLVSGELNQTELRLKAVFRDELRIEGDDRRSGDRFAEVAKVLVGGDVVVMHWAENEKLLFSVAAANNRDVARYELRQRHRISFVGHLIQQR